MDSGRYHILMIAPTPFFSDRGTHIRILEEALALTERGHRVTIATYHIGSELPRRWQGRIDVRRIRRWLFWYRKLEAGPDWQKLILDLMLLRKVFFLARTLRPDILHAHLHEGVFIGAVVKALLFWRHLPLVADFHGSLTKEMVSHAYLRAGLLRGLFRWVERMINRLGDGAVASSWDNAAEIAKVRGDEQIEVLPDGVRLENYTGNNDVYALREQYGLPRGKTIAMYTGAFIRNKGLDVLVAAMERARKREPTIHFVFAGYPENELKLILAGRGEPSAYTVISPLPYFLLPEVLALADLAIDPKEETTRQASGKLLPYMGAGLAVACFATVNNRAYLGEEAPLAERGAAGLADLIVELARDTPRRQALGATNRERAEQFSWGRSAEILEAMYAGLLVKRKKR